MVVLKNLHQELSRFRLRVLAAVAFVLFCLSASAVTSSRRRRPQAGSRSLRLRSNASLLGAVSTPSRR